MYNIAELEKLLLVEKPKEVITEETKDYKTDYDWTDLSDNPVGEQ